ncbi:MAG: hypothetical protein PWP64_1493 [Candidatus Cloacimonadota bacterium]|nr:hypothetical protein [Candidatus Cloacimonadota bacterium]
MMMLLCLTLLTGFIWAQGFETFDNFPVSDLPYYYTSTFTAEDGSEWNYIRVRGDYQISGNALMLGKDQTPPSQLYSGIISGGMGIISFEYMQAFSTDVNLTVMVNDVVLATLTSSNQQGLVLPSGNIPVNIAGDLVLKFINTDSEAGQVVIDNIMWTGYSGNPLPAIILQDTSLSGFSYSEGQGPSAAQNTYVMAVNLTEELQIAAASAFELSLSPEGDFTDALALLPQQGAIQNTAIYIRLKSDLISGEYAEQSTELSSLAATSREIILSGVVYPQMTGDGYFVDLEGEGETKGAYASGDVNLSGKDWNFTEALIGTDAADFKNGLRSVRLRGYGSSMVSMLEDKAEGLGNLSFLYRRYGSDAQVEWIVEYSSDSGESWNQIGSAFSAPASGDVIRYSENVNVPGNIRIRIKSSADTGSSNRRLNIDDILLTDYTAPSEPQINLTESALSGFAYSLGAGPSVAQSFSLSALNLTAALVLSVGTAYEISLNPDSGYVGELTLTPSSGSITPTTIWVRLKTDLPVGQYNQLLVLETAGWEAQSLPLSGNVLPIQIPIAPIALPASEITSHSFVANWQAAANAEEYYLDVYTYGSGSGPIEELFISEYIEGSSYNKAIEIFNGTGVAVDLSDYQVQLYSNGSDTISNSISLEGILADQDVFTISHSSADYQILQLADLTNSSVINFNGDDAIALYKESTSSYVDIFGVIGNDPGSAWTADGGYSTQDRTLVRMGWVTSGIAQNPSGTGAEAFTTLDSEWECYAQDTFSFLGEHTLTRETIAYVPGYQNLPVGNVTSYPVSGLDGDTQYFYVVRAANIYGSSEASNEIAVLTGILATPTEQASNLEAAIARTSLQLEWTPGNGARRMALINTNNSFTNPIDGNVYPANPVYSGSGQQVIYNDATQIIEGMPYNGILVENLQANTTYYFRVYEYNGSGSQSMYLTTTAPNNPAAFTTLEEAYTGYYSEIDGYGIQLKAQLHQLLRTTHSTEYSYDALWNQLSYTDEDPDNSNNIIQIYTGWSMPKYHSGGSTTEWNREHTWSKSHGGFDETRPAGTDLHHLRPCDATVNSAKGNKDFDNGGDEYVDASPYPGYSANTGCYTTSSTWEPRAEDKGDVARMMMYMAIRYEGTDTSYDLELVDYSNSSPSGQPYYGKLSTLLAWHMQDPPDAWEARRNERIWERQGNRNPFIDHPEFAQMLWTPYPQTATNISNTGFTATWSEPISGQAYYLQVAMDSLFTDFVSGFANYNAGTNTEIELTGLDQGSTYYYRLRTFLGSGYSMYSPFAQVSTTAPDPVPTTLSIEITSGAVCLRLTPVNTATAYRVFAADQPDDTFSDITEEGNFSDDTTWSCAVAENRKRFFKAYAIWE